MASPFEEDLDGYADAGGAAVELWLTKLEEYLKAHTPAEVKARAQDRGLQFAAASFQGGLLLSTGEARRTAWGQFVQRLDLCADLGVPVLVMTPDFLGPFTTDDIQRAQQSLYQAGETAALRGIKLALEFQARYTFLNNLETAASFVASVQQPHVGLCLDLFHFQIGPSKLADLSYLTPDNLFHVHVSDMADRPRELATDQDRVLPGDGDFPLREIFGHLGRIGYTGYCSLELLNPLFWNIAARQVGEIGLTALRVSLGIAQRPPGPID